MYDTAFAGIAKEASMDGITLSSMQLLDDKLVCDTGAMQP